MLTEHDKNERTGRVCRKKHEKSLYFSRLEKKYAFGGVLYSHVHKMGSHITFRIHIAHGT